MTSSSSSQSTHGHAHTDKYVTHTHTQIKSSMCKANREIRSSNQCARYKLKGLWQWGLGPALDTSLTQPAWARSRTYLPYVLVPIPKAQQQMGQHVDHVGLEELPQHGAEHLEGKQRSWGRGGHSAGSLRASTRHLLGLWRLQDRSPAARLSTQGRDVAEGDRQGVSNTSWCQQLKRPSFVQLQCSITSQKAGRETSLES